MRLATKKGYLTLKISVKDANDLGTTDLYNPFGPNRWYMYRSRCLYQGWYGTYLLFGLSVRCPPPEDELLFILMIEEVVMQVTSFEI